MHVGRQPADLLVQADGGSAPAYQAISCSGKCCHVAGYRYLYPRRVYQGYTTDSVHVVETTVRYVSPEYFDVMRIPLLQGNVSDWNSTASPLPAVVTRDLADSLFRQVPGRWAASFWIITAEVSVTVSLQSVPCRRRMTMPVTDLCPDSFPRLVL